MKPIIRTFLLAFSFLVVCSASATVWVVSAEGDYFQPSSLTLNLGDTVRWSWGDGSHTTTSTTVPAGAAFWNHPLTAVSPFYEYIPEVAGEYDYICEVHFKMGMTGNFTVLDPNNIHEIHAVMSLAVINPVAGNIRLTYELPVTGPLVIRLFDLTGKEIQTLVNENSSAGEYVKTYDMADLRRGIYLVQMRMGEAAVTKKIYIQ